MGDENIDAEAYQAYLGMNRRQRREFERKMEKLKKGKVKTVKFNGPKIK